jgi:membrane-associated protease RseP (regulator of RpoE activity)
LTRSTIECDPSHDFSNEAQYRSVDGDQALPITFLNGYTSLPVRVYWLDYAGQRKLYANVAPGSSYNVLSFMTHPWLVADSTDKCIAVYLPGEQVSQITIQKVRLGIVTADPLPQTESSLQLTMPQGVVIKEIIPLSPAEEAGLKPGDVIVKINDITIVSLKEALAAVQSSGAMLLIQVVRDGGELNLKAILDN